MKKSKDIMCNDFVKVTEDDSVLSAYKLMCSKGVRHLPVSNCYGHIVGLISDRDFQRAMVTEGRNPDPSEIYISPEKRVFEYMGFPVLSVYEDSPLKEIIQIMLDRKVSALMVENREGYYSGILTTVDVMECFLNVIDREEELKEKPLSFFMPNILF